MTPKQIYATVNDIAQNITKGKYNVVDYSSFVSFGNDVLSSETNTSFFIESLIDRIGRTIIAIDDYEASDRHVMVDSFTFGSALQKISFKLQDASENSDWSKFSATPYDVEGRDGIINKLYAVNVATFNYEDVIPVNQIESAFVSAERMSAFIDGLFQRMRNSREVAKEGLEEVAIASLVHKKAKMFSQLTSANTKYTYRDLLGEYNETHETPLTDKNCWNSKEFLEFVCIEMGVLIPKMKKLTSMYNDGTVERSSTKDDLVIEIPARFSKTFDVMLQSNTFHKELTSLPNYNVVPYWVSDADEMSIKLTGDGSTFELKNVIAIIRDKDAVLSTLDRERNVDFFDNWNNRHVVKMTAERRYIADTSENVVVFYVGSGVQRTISFNKNDGTGTMTEVKTYLNHFEAPVSRFAPPSSKEFIGWLINNDSSRMVHAKDIVNFSNNVYNQSGNTVLYAKFE